VEDKQSHLIERAAARLRLLDLEQGGARAPPASTAPAPDRLPSATESVIRPPARTGLPACIEQPALAKGGMIDWEQPHLRVAEEFRVVQNELLRQGFDENREGLARRGNVVMVTSALQGEGKSFTAINLSAAIARHGQRRVLLVDTDCSVGNLGDRLAISGAPGLLDLAADSRIDLDRVIVPTATEKLDVLPVGNTPERSAELLSSRRLGELIQEIGRRYSDRLVILDAPPCLASSAPNTLAAVVNQIILVVEANITQEGDVTAALELLQGCRHIFLVLNKIPPWTGHSFGTYYA
jgi:protein-tyrosine kinase